MMVDRMLRWPEVRQMVGLSRTTVWRMERTGQFPRRLQLTERITAWPESTITSWLASRVEVSSSRVASTR
jgi:prophage regulatory protein